MNLKWISTISQSLAIACLGTLVHADTPVTIFAAASLRGPLDEVMKAAPSPARISYGGSGAIARQVALGAPADLVVLANPAWGAWLETQNLPAKQKVDSLFSNRLVVIGPLSAAPFQTAPNADLILAQLADGRLAMGQRDAVPAGQYARQWLKAINAWKAVHPHLAETDNVRQALTLVARGETPLGVVYASDAKASNDVRVLWQIDHSLHEPIAYPARALTESGMRALDLLVSEAAKTVFRDAGFIVPQSISNAAASEGASN